MGATAIISGSVLLRGLDDEGTAWVKGKLTRRNPEFSTAVKFGYSTRDIPEYFENYREVDGGIVVPRGAWFSRLREQIGCVEIDRRKLVPVEWPAASATPRDYQLAAIEKAKERDGVILMPTGVGKTVTALELARHLGQRTLIVPPSTALADQWVEEAREKFGVSAGRVYGGSDDEGAVLTVALAASLNAQGSRRLRRMASSYGTVIVDECHGLAARTILDSVRSIRSRYRYGISADHRRGDRMEFAILDEIGPVLVHMERKRAEEMGAVVGVNVRVVTTEWPDLFGGYEDRHGAERAALKDVRRLALTDWAVSQAQGDGGPVLVFCGLRESVVALAERYGCPALLGGSKDFDAVREGLGNGSIPLAVATYRSFGQGIDARAIRSIVCATPIGKHERGFLGFNQLRGRAARLWEGKRAGTIYYLWDYRLHGRQVSNLDEWNDGEIEIWDERAGEWRGMEPTDFLGPRLW